MSIKRDFIKTRDFIEEIEKDSRFNAYGNFLDAFRFCKDQKIREGMIAERPLNDHLYPVDITKLACTVEILAKEYKMKIPAWCLDPKYILKEPNYDGYEREEAKQYMRDTTPKEAARRNLFFGDNFMSRA